MLKIRSRCFVFVMLGLLAAAFAQEPSKPTWSYSPELLRPFWQGDVIEGEFKDGKHHL